MLTIPKFAPTMTTESSILVSNRTLFARNPLETTIRFLLFSHLRTARRASTKKEICSRALSTSEAYLFCQTILAAYGFRCLLPRNLVN